jgi:hypothetical protein
MEECVVVTYFPFCAMTRGSITGVFLRILQRAKLELLQKLRYIIRYFFIEASNGYVTFEKDVTRNGSEQLHITLNNELQEI